MIDEKDVKFCVYKKNQYLKIFSVHQGHTYSGVAVMQAGAKTAEEVIIKPHSEQELPSRSKFLMFSSLIPLQLNISLKCGS